MEPAEPSTTAPFGSPAVPAGRPGWVLVVDDTDSIRLLIRVNLELAGFTVVDRPDGQSAVDLLEGCDPLPVVVVVDAQMEPRDGWWVVSWLREREATRQVPVVMVTAAVQDHERKRAGAIGVDAFVTKPFDPDELVDLVEGYAARGRAFGS
ncbi:response regulator [Dermatophilaceae bacterium Soc4.6]